MAQRQEITIGARRRDNIGSRESRRLRREGFVPLVIYGGGAEAVSAAAPLRDLAAILRSETGHNTIFTLDVDGVGPTEVIFHNRQLDPVTGRLVHADLKRLIRGQKIEVSVPLHLVGEPIGVKEQGGLLTVSLREVSISCRPRHIPDAINVDVSNLKVHDVLHVGDIPKDENIEILADPSIVIATVGVLRAEVETPTLEVAEPEVITKGKKEEEKS
jgi:large subunit ribosomal protein L25